MPEPRRVVRKLQHSGGAYFDEQLWPVQIALVVLGAFLMGISLAYLPLSGVPWYQTAWPSLLCIPLLVAAGIALLAYIDSSALRRSLQLSFVLCAILHVALVVQMVRMRILSSHDERPRHEARVVDRPPPKLTPEYHPTQLIPEEDRPRQDFEKPIETQSPEPTRDARQIARQPAEQDRSPAEPQPVPTSQQERTTEPNVVRRNVPNEAVPRLSPQPSKLSRQARPTEAKASELIPLPKTAPQPAMTPELRPSDTAVAQQKATPSRRPPQKSAPTSPTSPTEVARSPAARRSEGRAPQTAIAAASMPRRETVRSTAESPASLPDPRVAASPPSENPPAAAPRGEDALPQPSRLALSRGEAGVAGRGRSVNIDSSQPSGESPALVASGAARRAESTQRAPAGPAMSPAAPAQLTRSRAGAEIPTSPVRAEQLDVANTAATRQVAEITASSSSALTRADATARRDAVTAAKGSGEIDLGPTQIVAEAKVGRASGGGQPVLSDHAVVQQPLTRANVAAGTPQALTSTSVDNIALPVARSQGTGAAVELSPAAVVTTRSTTHEPRSVTAPRADAEQPQTATDSLAIGTSNRPQRADENEEAPSISDLPARTTASKRSAPPASSLPATSNGAIAVDIPEIRTAAPAAPSAAGELTPQPTRLTIERGGREAMTLEVPEPAGPSGLGTEFTPDVGVNSRQARADSVNLELRAARFVRRDVGGLPAVSTAAVIAADAFSGRAARVRGDEPAGGSGTPAPLADEAIERGLVFLARYQQPDGSWSLQGFPEGASLVSDTAATAMAVLAFQGAGYNHREFQYKDVIRGGLDSLIKSQKDNGDLYVPLDDASSRSVWLYSHSLAAIALCEAYGMTQDPALRDPAQRAIDFIVASQHRDRGGWRYAPGVSTDTSVTGWMLMAMKSGELAGLDVPPAAYANIARWLDLAQHSAAEPHLFRYNPYAPDTPEQRHGRDATKTMTAVGLLMRLYTGWERDDPRMLRGASYLVEILPAIGTPRDQQRDTYHWYYATLVLAHVGGEPWQAWNGQLSPLLVGSQVRLGAFAGSWDPLSPVPDRWGPHAGRIYVTALNLLSLEVQNRKLRTK